MVRYQSVRFLRLSLGVFFLILGIIGIIPHVQESIFTLNDVLGLEILFGIVEVICALMLLSGFFPLRRKNVSYGSLVVLLFWLLRIFLTKFIWGLKISNAGVRFIPGFSTWLLVLSCELIIAAAIYVVYQMYDKE